MLDVDARCEQALVRSGWEMVDLLGSLDSGKSRKLLAARWEAERSRAADTLTPLRTGPKMGSDELEIYARPSVQTRFRRTLDYVQPGDRIVEIGPGRGYLAGLLLRDGQAEAYWGMDIRDENLQATQETLELNGGLERAKLGICDIYDIDSGEIAEFQANLVLCCEVLEHVPDPERAVKTLAAALPAEADLLLSVPLLGRLEAVWGHLAIFDAARVRAMVEDSGLTVHAVDIVDNIWAFVLASHRAGPSPRAVRAADVASWPIPPRNVPTTMRSFALDAPDIAGSTRTNGLRRHEITQAQGLMCELTAKRRPWSRAWAHGGVRLPVTTPRGLRIELDIDNLDMVPAVYVDAYAGAKRVARWKWDTRRRPSKMPATFVMRRGRTGGYLRPVKIGALETADAFEVYLALRPGASARLRIIRAATIV